MLGPTDLPLDLEECGERVAQCIAAVWRGEAESDSLNRLIINAGLDWRRVAILRAYRKYRQRIGSRFTEGYQNDVIAANPHITAKLIRLFELRNDPAIERDEEAEAALREDILVDLEAVPSLDHDRILRNQLGLIEATVRTNAYRSGRRSIAFKLSSADVPAIPQPPPLFEIYVYAPEVEGIHLRGGRIARGGLRWSDRMDYRTEVFGLMRAQMTKNAVIVPDGAKGGFYLRRRPDDPAALKAEVERGYVTFVSGLLDLTDNLVEGEVVHPEGVRVLDDDDTYLVVAADKGTATFSDTANRVAGRYGFWLGDAFASGGSKGYDHKALGITARGAWESLKRHFRELEMDPAVDEFTAVGIGDMSGDVFGNGMLLSDKIRLVAAYDHRHVFIDPDPDAAKGFAERKRLFELAGSSWDDYDRAAISEGGGVWQRSAKRIELSEQARAALGIDDAVLAPTEVIRAILRAPVDVFWNGGIGTVVKASTESDAEALDRSSDAIRVDAGELRCRVVAEGGNLGLTQRARIEFAREGGLVNADFIDNSAGVDCSDHEVNLKVLLDLAVRRGELDAAGRDALLAEVTEDVAAHVLYDSFLQAQMLAQEVRGSATRMFAYEDLMAALEAEGLLHRDGRVPAQLRGDGRPPAVRAAGWSARSWPCCWPTPSAASPARCWSRRCPTTPTSRATCAPTSRPPSSSAWATCWPSIPLRRELVATIVSNHVVNALGPTFVSRLVAEQGAEPADVVRALPHRARRHRGRGALGGHRAPHRRRSATRSGSSWRTSTTSSRPPRAGTWRTRAGPTWRSPIATGPRGLRPAGRDPGRAGQREPARGPRARGRRGRRARRARGAWPAALAYLPGMVARARRHRGQPGAGALGRGRRTHLLAAGGPRGDRVDRGAARRAARQHADAALGAAGAARRPLARPARPRPARAGGVARRAGAGRGRGVRRRAPGRDAPASPGSPARWRGRAAPTSPASAWPSGSCARSRAETALARQARAHDEAAADRSRAQLAAAQGHALAHPDQSLLAAAGAARDPAGDLDLQALRRPAQGDPRLAAAAVLERVGQALLHEPERGQVNAGRERPRLALDVEVDLEAGVARACDERAETLERRLRGVLGVLALGAQDVQQAAHLGERLAARRLHGAQRADRGAGVAVQGAPRRSRLDDHDRDVVGDDIVQLECDPRALGEHRRVVAPGAVALELAALLVETPAEVPARTQDPEQGERLRDGDRRREHGSVRAGSSARPNALVRVQRPIPRDGRPAPAGCRRPQG